MKKRRQASENDVQALGMRLQHPLNEHLRPLDEKAQASEGYVSGPLIQTANYMDFNILRMATIEEILRTVSAAPGHCANHPQ